MQTEVNRGTQTNLSQYSGTGLPLVVIKTYMIQLTCFIDFAQDSKHCGEDAAEIFSLRCVNNR